MRKCSGWTAPSLTGDADAGPDVVSIAVGSSSYDWVPFYEEFADRVLSYRDDHQSLIRACRGAFVTAHKKFPKLEAESEALDDIDPFTVFSLFNRGYGGRCDNHRAAIMRGFKAGLGMRAAVPRHTDGVPLLYHDKARFYSFEGDPLREADEKERLWDLFENAIVYADDPSVRSRTSLIASYECARSKTRNLRKLTMGLYWMRPRTFLSLDRRTAWYVWAQSGLPFELTNVAERIYHDSSFIPDGTAYMRFCDIVRTQIGTGTYPFTDFVGLVDTAYRVSLIDDEWERAGRTRAPRYDAIAPEPLGPAASVDEVHCGTEVWHCSFGAGVVEAVGDERIRVCCGGRSREFAFPQAFEQGYLSLRPPKDALLG